VEAQTKNTKPVSIEDEVKASPVGGRV